MTKKSKFGPKLREFKRIKTILEKFLATSQNNFSKILNRGTNKLKSVEKIKKSLIQPPPHPHPTIRDKRVMID